VLGRAFELGSCRGAGLDSDEGSASGSTVALAVAGYSSWTRAKARRATEARPGLRLGDLELEDSDPRA
jgi:hypothetical protein